LALRAKTATVVKLMGRFCSFFFLEGQNRNFENVRGLKLLLNQKKTKVKKYFFVEEAKQLIKIGTRENQT